MGIGKARRNKMKNAIFLLRKDGVDCSSE